MRKINLDYGPRVLDLGLFQGEESKIKQRTKNRNIKGLLIVWNVAISNGRVVSEQSQTRIEYDSRDMRIY